MFLTAKRNFWQSCLMPRATSKEIAVDFLASRTRKTVPLRRSRTIGSPASERCLHQTRLTLSLPTAWTVRDDDGLATAKQLTEDRLRHTLALDR